jgi:RNA methyltransferase, TrmH family
VIAKRPEDVVRIACMREILPDVEEAFRAHGRAMDIGVLDEHGIERLARTAQHEGLCLEVRARRWMSAQDLGDRLVSGPQPRNRVAIALDRVRNSYNIGAILRSAAFFGVDSVLLGAPAPHPGLDPNAVRVAEGAVEHLVLSRTTDLADTLSRLRARGVTVVGTDGQATTSALEYRFSRPSLVVLGNEREGLGPRVRAQCDAMVAIRGGGSGNVESLNVGVAAGILIAQLTRAALVARDS